MYQVEFEKWYLAESIFNDVDKTPSGLSTAEIYCKPATRRAWAAWRAGVAAAKRAEASSQEILDAMAGEPCSPNLNPRLVEAMQNLYGAGYIVVKE